MFSFYGDISAAMPCVICDAGMRVLFANRTAYGDPVTVKWIDQGKPNFDKRLLKAMEGSFESEPFAIARLDIRRGGKNIALLADRQSVCGATVYVLALAKGEDEESTLPTELDGRRMITACFSPSLCGACSPAPFNSELAHIWADTVSKAAEKAGKALCVSSDISAVSAPVKSCNALLACAGAIAAAYCANARRDIGVSLREDRFGVSFVFSAEMVTELEASLVSAASASVIASCFAASAFPMLVAMQIAEGAGFSVTADTHGKSRLSVTLRANSFDIGDCGFKVPSDFIGNAKTAIYAVSEMLI